MRGITAVHGSTVQLAGPMARDDSFCDPRSMDRSRICGVGDARASDAVQCLNIGIAAVKAGRDLEVWSVTFGRSNGWPQFQVAFCAVALAFLATYAWEMGWRCECPEVLQWS